MVYGDDNSSLPQTAFVSHSPCGLGVLVLIGLLTLSIPLESETAFAHSPVLKFGPVAAGLGDFAEEAPWASSVFENAPQPTLPFRAAILRRDSIQWGNSREALSQAGSDGFPAALNACIETWHRFARLTGGQRPRGTLSRGPDPNGGRLPFVGWDGFPPTARCS